jgi:hypothetical protein
MILTRMCVHRSEFDIAFYRADPVRNVLRTEACFQGDSAPTDEVNRKSVRLRLLWEEAK